MATYGGDNDQARVTPIAIKRKPRVDPNKTGTLVSKLLKAANQQGVNIDHPESDKYTASASKRSRDKVSVHRPDEVKPTQKPKIVDDGKVEDLYGTGTQFTKPTRPDKALKLMLKGDDSDEDFQLGVGRESVAHGKQSTPPRATNLVNRLKKGKKLSQKFYSDADMTQREMDTNDANNAPKPKSIPGKAVKDAVSGKQLSMFGSEKQKARQQRDGKGVDPSGKDPSEKLDIRDNLQVLANLNTDLAKSHSFPLTSGEKTGPVMRGEPSAMYAADGKALEEDPMARKIDIRDKNDSKLEANERTVENKQDSQGRITTVMLEMEAEPTICSSLAVFNEILNKTEYDEKRVREQGASKRSKRRAIANSAADVAAQQINDTRGI